MSINLKTNCKDCVHKKVCKNHGMAESFNERICERICDLIYGSGTNDDYDYYHMEIDISCIDFEKKVPTRIEQLVKE